MSELDKGTEYEGVKAKAKAKAIAFQNNPKEEFSLAHLKKTGYELQISYNGGIKYNPFTLDASNAYIISALMQFVSLNKEECVITCLDSQGEKFTAKLYITYQDIRYYIHSGCPLIGSKFKSKLYVIRFVKISDFQN